MKNPIIIRIIPALLLATAAFAAPEPKKEIVIRHIDKDGPDFEKEKVAFLGVETIPVDRTVAAQLGLPRDTGLVVRHVADGSPAATLLQEHDVLTKLDDQILIDMHQLSVLVRSRKAGDEVKLTVVRAGKETIVKAKLGEREVPKMAMDGGRSSMQFFQDDRPGGNMFFNDSGPGQQPSDIMRMIGGDRMHWFANPRVHVRKLHGGQGSTILDLPSASFVVSDDEGEVSVLTNEGKRELTVKDKQGKITFQGPINSSEDQMKLPPEVMARLKAIGGAELGDDDEDLEIETKMLPPATKTRQLLPSDRAPEAGLRTL